MKRYIIGEKPKDGLNNVNTRTLAKVVRYIENHGPQDLETIKMLCGRHRPGDGDSPSSFIRYAVDHNWLKPEGIKM